MSSYLELKAIVDPLLERLASRGVVAHAVYQAHESCIILLDDTRLGRVLIADIPTPKLRKMKWNLWLLRRGHWRRGGGEHYGLERVHVLVDDIEARAKELGDDPTRVP